VLKFQNSFDSLTTNLTVFIGIIEVMAKNIVSYFSHFVILSAELHTSYDIHFDIFIKLGFDSFHFFEVLEFVAAPLQ